MASLKSPSSASDGSIAHSASRGRIGSTSGWSWRDLWQPLLFALTLIFLMLWLRSQWGELRAYPWRFDGRWLALAVALLISMWLLEVSIWRRVLRTLGGELRFGQAWRIWFLSTLTRYIPGNVWQPLTMTLYCRRHGIAPETTVASMALNMTVLLLAGVPIGVTYFLWSGNWGLLGTVLGAGGERWAAVALIAALLPTLVFAVRPHWLLGALNWALRRAGRPTLVVNLSVSTLIALLLTATVSWLCWGGSFAALTFALGDFTRADVLALAPHLAAVYAVAYFIGYVSFITPSGLGVREGVVYLLLAPLLDGGLITVAALGMRLFSTLAEALIAGLLLLVPVRS